MEVQRKAKKDQTDAQMDAAKLKLEQGRVQIEAMKEAARVKSQEGQAKEKLRLDALKVLAMPKPAVKPPTKKE